MASRTALALLQPGSNHCGRVQLWICSMKFYAPFGFGGVLSCGLTHTAVIPLDLVKCHKQVGPQKYKGERQLVCLDSQLHFKRMVFVVWLKDGSDLHQLLYAGLLKFGFYEPLKSRIATRLERRTPISGAHHIFGCLYQHWSFCWHCPGSYGSC